MSFSSQTVLYQYLFPTQSNPFWDSKQITVIDEPGFVAEGLSPAFPPSFLFDLDIDRDTITIRFNIDASFTSSSFNGFAVSDINDTVPKIIYAEIISSTGNTPDGQAVSWDENNVYLNFTANQSADRSFSSGAETVIDVDFLVEYENLVAKPDPLNNTAAINLRSKGVTPFVLYGGAEPLDGGPAFDPYLVNIESLVVSDDMDEVINGGGAGVAAKTNGKLFFSYEDINSDGLIDLLFKVNTSLLAGFVQPGASAVYVGGNYGSDPLDPDTFVAVDTTVNVFA